MKNKQFSAKMLMKARTLVAGAIDASDHKDFNFADWISAIRHKLTDVTEEAIIHALNEKEYIIKEEGADRIAVNNKPAVLATTKKKQRPRLSENETRLNLVVAKDVWLKYKCDAMMKNIAVSDYINILLSDDRVMDIAHEIGG